MLVYKQKKSSLKSAFIFINLFFIVAFIGSLVICVYMNDYNSNNSFAIVTSKSIPTFIDNSPSPKTTILEGTRVEIISNNLRDKLQVKLSTGQIHIVSFNDLSII